MEGKPLGGVWVTILDGAENVRDFTHGVLVAK
jgi:hypothetical protein